MADTIDNPYIGPRAFSGAEGTRFFGREREARDLLSLVISQRLVLFYAPSGAGKSSLINTRLIPGLKGEGYVTLPVGRVSGDLPAGINKVKNIYAFNLMLNLDQSQSAPIRLTDLALTEFLAHLTTRDGEYYYYRETLPESSHSRPAHYTPPPHVMIIDQFEEIITTYPERWEDRADFFRQLEQALASDPDLWIVLTLREDYVAALDPYAALLPGRMQTRFYMQKMGYEAALEAVAKPAEQYGRPFNGGVGESLVDNLRQIRVSGSESPGQTRAEPGQFVEPVQLQVVCFQLWEQLKDRPVGPITQQDLEELGNVDQALGQFYEQALARTLQRHDVSEIDLRNWFEQRLITEAATRGTVYQGARETAGLPNRVVRTLADQFLVRVEIRAGGTWYELIHDRLIEPIRQSNRRWRERQPLLQVALEWHQSGRGTQQLLEGQILQDALQSNWQGLGTLVRDFLEASQAAQRAKEEALEREKEAQRQRELTVIRQRDRVLRWALTIGIILLILTMGGFGWALVQRQAAWEAQIEADTARQAAIDALATAQIASTRAIEAQIQAFTARQIADVEGTRALEAEIEAVTAKGQAELAAQTAEAERMAAQAAQSTTQAGATEVYQAREELAENLETQVAAASFTPTPTPSSTSTPTLAGTPVPRATPTATPTVTPTPTPNEGATATVIALQTIQVQLTAIRATQTVAAKAADPQPLSIEEPMGRIIFFSNRDGRSELQRDLYILDIRTGDIRRLAQNGDEPSYSAETDTIAFSKIRADQRPSVSLYTIDPDGRNENSIDRQFWDNWEPAISPDGRRVAFVSSRLNRGWEIYVMSLSQKDPDELLPLTCDGIPVDYDKWGPTWSPDGRAVAFVVQPEASQLGEFRGQADIWAVEVESSDCEPLTKDGLSQRFINKRPAWSPDGRRLAYVSNRDGDFELYLLDVTTGRFNKIRNSPLRANYPAWSADGDWLAFTTTDTNDIFAISPDGNNLQPIIEDAFINKAPVWINN